MLTDIFADRYLNRELWKQYTEIEAKLLNQSYRIVAEQLFPYWIDGKESPAAKAKWTLIHDRLSMELGLHELAPKAYAYPWRVGPREVIVWNRKAAENGTILMLRTMFLPLKMAL